MCSVSVRESVSQRTGRDASSSRLAPNAGWWSRSICHGRFQAFHVTFQRLSDSPLRHGAVMCGNVSSDRNIMYRDLKPENMLVDAQVGRCLRRRSHSWAGSLFFVLCIPTPSFEEVNRTTPSCLLWCFLSSISILSSTFISFSPQGYPKLIDFGFAKIKTGAILLLLLFTPPQTAS